MVHRPSNRHQHSLYHRHKHHVQAEAHSGAPDFVQVLRRKVHQGTAFGRRLEHCIEIQHDSRHRFQPASREPLYRCRPHGDPLHHAPHPGAHAHVLRTHQLHLRAALDQALRRRKHEGTAPGHHLFAPILRHHQHHSHGVHLRVQRPLLPAMDAITGCPPALHPHGRRLYRPSDCNAPAAHLQHLPHREQDSGQFALRSRFILAHLRNRPYRPEYYRRHHDSPDDYRLCACSIQRHQGSHVPAALRSPLRGAQGASALRLHST